MIYQSAFGIIRQSALFMVFIAFLSIFAGVLLETNLEVISSFPSILLVIPAFIDACGDITSTFAARLTSSLRLGLANFAKKKRKIYVNVESTMTMTLIFFSFLSALAYATAWLFGLNAPPIHLFVIAIIVSSVFVVALLILLAVAVAYVGLKRGLDPDNFEAPMLSTVSDFVGVFVFINVCRIIFLGG